MKRFSNRTLPRLVTEISLTPFLDLVLVLLFAFLLTAPLLKGQKTLLTEVPPVSVEPPPAVQVKLVMYRDLSVTLNGAMLARADLPASLKQLAVRFPAAAIEVQMHQSLNVQTLVETMNLLEVAGIRKTAVTTHNNEL